MVPTTNQADINQHAFNWLKIAEEMKGVIDELCKYKEQKNRGLLWWSRNF